MSADDAIRRGYLMIDGKKAIPYTLRTPGYDCKALSGGLGGATIECKHGFTAFRFTYGT
jgi:hypothetical protein